MKRSKKDPVAPSASSQRSAGAGNATLSWPAVNTCPLRSRYIARSAMIGAVASMRADTSAASSESPSSQRSMSTHTVRRAPGGTV